jgi:uncharacterized protein
MLNEFIETLLRFANLASQSSLFFLLGAALLGGLVRGFTGFGFAMVFVPVAAVAVGPMLAVATIWFMDLPFALPLAGQVWRKTNWREVLPLLAGALVLLPLGTWLLTTLDPALARWIIALSILLAVFALATGWRYTGNPGLPLSLGVGGMSGLASGLAQLGGMPLAVFWLAAQKNDPAQTRANLFGYFGVMPFFSGLALWWSGVLTLAAAKTAMVLCVVYGLGLMIGSKSFHLASEQTFRRIAYGVIILAAITAMPVMDGLIRP